MLRPFTLLTINAEESFVDHPLGLACMEGMLAVSFELIA
jgi:hypothetical protein